MGEAVDGLAVGLRSADCTVGGRTSWTFDGVTQGPMACYYSNSGYTTMIWGSTSLAVLAVAQDPDWSLTTMYTWWEQDGPNFQ